MPVDFPLSDYRPVTITLRVGLTGGIACGKSHSTRVLAELGAQVIDADELAHEVVKAGGPAYAEIVAYFGESILGSDGEIDRKRLGKIIFADANARIRLNSIVHPRVIDEERARSREIAERVGPCLIVVDAALMIEAGYHRTFEKLVVVHCRPELQIHRLISRDGLTFDEAMARIATQMPISEKLKLADYIIETSGTYRQTRAQILAVHGMLQDALRSKLDF